MSFFFNNITGVIFAIIIVLICILIKKRINYFADKGLYYIKPSLLDQLKALTVGHQFTYPIALYEKHKGNDKGYIGFFNTFLTPTIIMVDNSLVESIMIKDFSHFQDHGIDVDVKENPLFGHLFTMKGDQWRTLRNKLTPTFTSGKLKGMVPIMEQCAENLIKEMKGNNNLRDDVNLKQLYNNYTLAVIAICAFGLDPESLKDPDCEFKKLVNQVLNPSILTLIKITLITLLPPVAKLLKLKLASKDLEDFFFSLTKKSFEIRKKSGVKRNDFIQLLLELKEKGSVEVDTKDLEEDEKETMKEIQSQTLTKLELTDELLTAQVFIFLIAGFDNSSYIAAITTYFLGKHLDIQERVREEIKEIKSKHGKMDYLALRDMKLLSACVDEALRLIPPVPFLLRMCNKDYNLRNGQIVNKGCKVIIPVKGLHGDSKYWSNPDEFNPDRFLSGEKIQPGTYLPFGDGPRICIAQRLALLMGKMMLAKIIQEYEILPCSKTQEPIEINPFRGADAKGGIWTSFRPISNN